MVVLKGLPQSGDHESCPVSGYMVRVRQQGVKRAQVRKVDKVKQTITLQHLMPDTTYNVKLITITCEGKGKPSRWLTFRTPPQDGWHKLSHYNNSAALISEHQKPGLPRMVLTQSYGDSIFVSWQPPDGPAPVQGYVVGYGEGVPDVNWQYIEGHRRNVTIRNLKKGTQYVISVRAYNSEGKGPVTYELVYTNENSIPFFSPPPPPTNLRCKAISPTSVTLEWIDPSLPPQNLRSSTITDNRYYNVHYQSINPSTGQLVERSETAKKLQVTINGLTPATTYQFKVRTVKDGQAGQFSMTVANRTHETAPGSPPRSVSVTLLITDEELGTGKALVQWRPPRLTNGKITDYMVQFTDNVELASENWQFIMVKHKSEAIVENLEVGNSYYFRVQARNSYGYGPKSDITKLYVQHQESNAIPQSSTPSTTITTAETTSEEDADEDDNDDYDEYSEPDQSSLKDQEDESIQRNLHTDANKRKREQSLHSPDLEEMNPAMSDQMDVDFKVLLQFKVTAFITWPPNHPSYGCQSGVRPKGYKLRYKKLDSNERSWITHNLQDHVALLEDLEVNSKYVYQVKYVMEVDSPWSGLQHLSTYPGQPASSR